MSEKLTITFRISFHERRLPATNLFSLFQSFNSVGFVCTPHNTSAIIITHNTYLCYNNNNITGPLQIYWDLIPDLSGNSNERTDCKSLTRE